VSIILKIKKAIKNPQKAIQYLLEGGEFGRQKKILSMLSDHTNDLIRLKELELFLNADLKKYYDELISDLDYKKIEIELSKNWRNLGVFGLTEVRIMYVLVRHVKPKIVIETGVASGLSSVIFLLAITKNQLGKLYSIDLPPSEELNKKISQHTTIPRQKNVGWLVPVNLRERWTLMLGDSKIILPDLLKKENNVDIFLHDSDHSFEHMMWEYETVWPYLKKILLSDDIYRHDAFDKFVKDHQCRFYKISRRMGIMIR
jgi:hypothetical protein